jgi:hypothetical protein
MAVILFSARRSLQSGVDELRLAQDRIPTLGSHASLHNSLGSVRADVVQARSAFRSADNRLAPLVPLFDHLGWVPAVGSEIAAAPHLARAATRTTEDDVSLIDGLDPLATRWDHTSVHRSPSRIFCCTSRDVFP